MTQSEQGATNVPSQSKPTLTVSLCSVFSVLAAQLEEPLSRQIFVILASPLGFFTSFLVKQLLKMYNDRKVTKKLNQIIADLQAQRAAPGLTRKQCSDLDKEISTFRKTLQKHELDNVKLDVDIS